MHLNRPLMPRVTSKVRHVCFGAMVGLGAAGMVMAQPAVQSVTQVTAAGVSSTAPVQPNGLSGPAWAALTPLQRQALAPLASTWDKLNAGQQRKWLEVSRNYPALPPTDQAKMHGRMSEWVALSARERSAARLNFAATTEIAKELSPQEKKAKWDAYQALSQDERKKLAEQASRPRVGAAPATRPVAPQKLAALPSTKGTAASNPKVAGQVKPDGKSALGSPADAANTAAVPAERVER